MNVAIVHDFLVQMGGAEKVVEVLHDMFPDAPIYTSAYDREVMPDYYRAWDIRTSFLQRLPFKRWSHRLALPLYALAMESFDLSEYDLVISSSSAFAKGIITQPHTTHICYMHAPMRFAWTARNYMKNERAGSGARFFLLPVLHYLRNWDVLSASRVDHYVANSSVVAGRIRKYYSREAEIIFPPVETKRFQLADTVGDYYIVVSRFVPYKRIDMAIEAFNQLKLPLKVVGEGRQRKELEALAGPNVEFLGRVGDSQLPRLLARAKGFLMPGEEDFGIAPVEANACGVPVIALAAGGALDTQVDGVTGVMFRERSAESLAAAVQCAEKIPFNRDVIREHALQFDTAVFKTRIAKMVSANASSGDDAFPPLRHRQREAVEA